MTAVEVNVMLSSSSSSRKLGPASVDSGGHSVSRTWDRERHKLGLTTAAAVGAALELMMGLFKLTINGQKGYQVQRVSEGTATQQQQQCYQTFKGSSSSGVFLLLMLKLLLLLLWSLLTRETREQDNGARHHHHHHWSTRSMQLLWQWQQQQTKAVREGGV